MREVEHGPGGRTTLLVHGGCHGAWCWDGVIEELAARGERGVAFDLPGCGSDMTRRTEVGLGQQVERLIAQIDATPEGPVRLVGHSIGGWLLAPAAAARPDRVDEIVFFAGAVLNCAERGIDLTPVERQSGYFAFAEASPDNSLMLPFAEAHARFFNHLDDVAALEAYRQLTPQPFQPYLDPAVVGIEDVSVARRYLAADDDLTYPAAVTAGFAARAGADVELIPGDHCLMLSAPAILAAALS